MWRVRTAQVFVFEIMGMRHSLGTQYAFFSRHILSATVNAPSYYVKVSKELQFLRDGRQRTFSLVFPHTVLLTLQVSLACKPMLLVKTDVKHLCSALLVLRPLCKFYCYM